MFLVNSRHHLVAATSFSSNRKGLHLMEAHLLPKLRCQFAEFLRLGSLKRLGILTPPTCVGLRYGPIFRSTRGFSWKHGITDFALSEDAARRRLSALRGYLWFRISPAYGLSPRSVTWLSYPSPSPLASKLKSGTGILTCFPSPTPCGLGLGSD
jgi:hypothetical protein